MTFMPNAKLNVESGQYGINCLISKIDLGNSFLETFLINWPFLVRLGNFCN